jgi:hypothetical protein
MRTKLIFLTTLYFSMGIIFNLFAQDEPLFEKLKKDFNKEYLSIGALIQVVGDFQNERSFAGTNGFNISNFRWRIYGKMDKNLSYFLQANFIKSPAFLDAYIGWQINSWLQLKSGLFKAPFSKEYLTSASDIDFVNRSQVVSALTPGRQIGVQFSGWLSNKLLYYAVGAFNGNNFRINSNDNDEFLYAARLACFPKLSSTANQLEIGITAATSNDYSATIPGIYSSFEGKRSLIGADVRLTIDRLLLAGEAIFLSLKPDFGNKIEPQGFQFTGGYMMSSNSQLLVRFDSFQTDKSLDSSDLLIFGYNLWTSKIAEFQANYIIDMDQSDFKNHQLLFNLQINFN